MTKRADRQRDALDMRQRAEALAREAAARETEAAANLSPEELQRTLQELRVHQIELEMQNEELRRAQEEIDALCTRYCDLYDLAPVGLCTLSEEGLILEANLTLATLLGLARGGLVKQPVSRFILKEDQDIYYLQHKQLFEPGEPQQCELRLVRPDGAPFWAQMTATADRAEDGSPLCRVIISDITERRRAAEALRESEARFKQLAAQGRTFLWEIDLQGLYTFVDPMVETILGYRPEELIGRKHFFDLAPADERDKIKEMGLTVAREAESVTGAENRILAQEGRVIWVSSTVVPLRGELGEIIGSRGSDTDISDRKQRESLREAGREILQILNEPGELQKSIQRVLSTLKTLAGFDAVGLRLQEGEDFPYLVQDGFSKDFLLTEDTLVERDKDGGVCRDKDGNVRLECTCGLVLSGKTDPSNPLFTQGGSCCTNDSFLLLDLPPDQDPRLHPRNNCIHQGYASVALMPIRTHGRIVGLLQLNAKRRNCFTSETIEILEGIAAHIGSAFMRKQAEETLSKSENLFRKVFEILPIGLWIGDKNGTLNQGNPAGVAIWGAEPKVAQDQYGVFEARRLPAGEIIAPDDWALAHTVNKGETIVDELLEIAAFDGSKKIILNYTAPVLDEQGNIHATIVVNQDITAQYHANKALEDEKTKFLMLLSSLPGYIYLQAPDYSVRYANKEFIELFGEIKDRTCYEIIRGRTEPCVNCPTFEVFKTKMPHIWEWSQGPDGKTYIVYDLPFVDSDGSLLVLEYGVDITERKRAEEEQARLSEMLSHAQKMEAIGTLAGGVAHDFNNILGAILMTLSLLELERGEVNRLNSDMIGDLKSLALRGADLTKQLLGFGRRGRFDPKPVDVREVVDRMSSMFGQTHREITIDRSLSMDPSAAIVDQSQFEQVLLNLFVNAAQAMPDGGRLAIRGENATLTAAETEPHGAKPGRFIRLVIADTGTGIDPAILPRIFEPFFTTRAPGRGTGLGLASAYGIVKNHGGVITVESEVGKGTAFTILLPSTDRLPAERPAVQTTEQPGLGTILVVDDEEQLLKSYASFLRATGYEVLTASGGRTAVDLVRQQRDKISLVILDLTMPDMSGAATFDAIREIVPTMKVLLASGFSIDGQAQALLDRGCNGFIQKPFDVAMLLEKLQVLK